VSTPGEKSSREFVGNDTRIEVLLSEYRALNALLLFRLAALDRRLPLAGGLLTGSLAAIPALPNDARPVILWAVPAASVWLLADAIAQARSKEDHLHHLAEIERCLNRLAGQPLIRFQSSHPSRGRFVAGRSGQSTVVGITIAATAWLIGALYIAGTSVGLTAAGRIGFAAYVIAAASAHAHILSGLRNYRPRRRILFGTSDST